MKYIFGRNKIRHILLPEIEMSSDWFACTSCGYLVRMRVLGDTAHCSQCGGTMRRK